jgi:CBS domain protein
MRTDLSLVGQRVSLEVGLSAISFAGRMPRWSTPLSLLTERKIGSLPVVENGRLVGILTERDFVALIAREDYAHLLLTRCRLGPFFPFRHGPRLGDPQVARCDDADQLSMLDHRQGANLLRPEHGYCVFERCPR